MRSYWLNLLICTTVLFLITRAAIGKELTLNDAILLALRYNPSVQTAELQRVVEKFNLRVQEHNFEWQYALTGNAQYSDSTINGGHTTSNNYSLSPSATLNNTIGGQYTVSSAQSVNHAAGSNYTYSPGVTLSYTQPLLQGFGRQVTLSNLANARDQELVNQLNLKNTAISTITQVINNYVALVQAENSLKAVEASLQSTINTLNQYRAQVKAGREAPANLVQFQVNVANQQLDLQGQQMSVKQAQLALLNTLGIDPNIVITVPENPKIPDFPIPPLDKCIEIALKNNITYQTNLINVRINERYYLQAKDRMRPSLNLTASSTLGSSGVSGGTSSSSITNAFNGRNINNNLELQLTVPIDDMNLKSGEISAKTSLEQSKINLEASRRQVINEVTNAYNTLMSQKQQIIKSEETVRLAALNLQIANVKLKYGKISPFEASSLQNDLTGAQVTLINNKQGYINSLATFDQTLGVTLERWHIGLRY